MSTVKIIGDVTVETGVGTFVKKTLVDAPNTTIQNRAKVSNSLQAIMGTERIHVNSLNKLLKESGANGEPVFEPDNGDSRVRFVGNWQTIFANDGNVIEVASAGIESYVEVTFYGTGLNMLVYGDTGTRPMTVSVDGGATTVVTNTMSGVLTGRNYKMNAVKSIASGLALGWHTIKMDSEIDVPSVIRCYGFEILNEASQITVASGTAFHEGEKVDVAAALLDYNSGFENVGSVGSRGGRAVVAVDKADGVVKKYFTPTDVTPLYLGSADHTFEAPYRVINFREFGRNRGDDFSTLAGVGSDRAFTLDDGSTTLVLRNGAADGVQSGFRLGETTGFFTLTFFGTGLDVSRIGAASLGGTSDADLTDITVDGVSIGFSQSLVAGKNLTKVCSGLPLGMHTVKFFLTAEGGQDVYYEDFVIYQPKKPTLPEGAIEIAEYNLMADYALSPSGNIGNMSDGVLRKMGMRESVYTGSWIAPALDTLNFNQGFNFRTQTTGSTIEYEFYGTGILWNTNWNVPSTYDIDITIDGASDLSSYTTSFLSDTTGITFNGATGKVAGTSVGANAGLVEISGLPLGKHTIKVTTNNTQPVYAGGFDVITPIHSPHTTFGSRSLKDLRNFDSNKEVNREVKNTEVFAKVDRQNALIDKSKGISQVLNDSGGTTHVYFEEAFVDINIAMVGTCHIADKILGLYDYSPLLTISKIRVDTTSSAGAGEVIPYTVKASNKLQKDELEE